MLNNYLCYPENIFTVVSVSLYSALIQNLNIKATLMISISHSKYKKSIVVKLLKLFFLPIWRKKDGNIRSRDGARLSAHRARIHYHF